jgi:hypothetical protein
MKYMLFIYPDPTVELSTDERAGIPAAVSAWVREMQERRVRLLGEVLQPASEAAVVEVREGDVSVTRGPFAETERQISGFNILDVRISTRRSRSQQSTLWQRSALWS